MINAFARTGALAVLVTTALTLTPAAEGQRTTTSTVRTGTTTGSTEPFVIPGSGTAKLVSIKAMTVDQVVKSNDGVLDATDEIRVLLVTANLASPASDPDQVKVWISGEYEINESMARRPIGKNLWGMNGQPYPLQNLDDVAIICVVLESDTDEFTSFPAPVEKAVTARLIEVKNARMPRENIPYALELATTNAIFTASPYRPVGLPKAVRFKDGQLTSTLYFPVGHEETIRYYWGNKDSGEGLYSVEFSMKRER